MMDVDKFEILLRVRPEEEETKVSIALHGYIDLGNFEGLTSHNGLNFNEMRGIIYKRIFEEVEEAFRFDTISEMLGLYWVEDVESYYKTKDGKNVVVKAKVNLGGEK